MAKHVIKKNQTATVIVTEGNSVWILDKDATLSGDPALWNTNLDDVTFRIEGKIDSDGDGILSYGDGDDKADNTWIKIGQTGRILAGDAGVFVEGADSIVENAGKIRSSDGQAINISGANATVMNEGVIRSDGDSIEISDGAGFLIRNDFSIVSEDASAILVTSSGEGKIINGANGVIDGRIYVTDAIVTFINKGEYSAPDANLTTAITFGGDDDRLVNRGKMKGNVDLNDGNDTADMREGTFTDSTVYGGGGDDLFLLDNGRTRVFEADGYGHDQIRTTASYKLGFHNHIEVVEAVGKKDIDLSGSTSENYLVGNSGDNNLVARAGDDRLRGGEGADSLRGGAGADDFYFYTDCGKDIIHDFSQFEGDVIGLYFIEGITQFSDLADRIFVTKQDDTLIDLGNGDRIRLVGFDKDLTFDDFKIVSEFPFP